MTGCCTYQDMEKGIYEYGIQFIYNKKLIMEYNSTRGNWKGFTESAILWAEIYNSDPEDAKLRKIEQIVLCSENVHVFRNLKNMTAAPSVKVTSVKPSSGTHPAILLCSAYNFYPQNIALTWLRNGQEVTSDVTSTEVLSDGDLYYQVHSYLEYRPKRGDKISCMVEHVSLSEPLVLAWDLSWPDRVKIIVGTCVLVFGLTMLIVGYVIHRKQSTPLAQ